MQRLVGEMHIHNWGWQRQWQKQMQAKVEGGRRDTPIRVHAFTPALIFGAKGVQIGDMTMP